MIDNDCDPNIIYVLDQGYVRLVDHMGSDLSVVRAARVSYNAAWRVGEDEGKDKKLIKFMWCSNPRHSSPFEAVTFTFEVKAPIFVFRQWHRHRTQSYNEMSARYTEMSDEFYVPDPALIGVQSKINKQARVMPDDTKLIEERTKEVGLYAAHCKRSFEEYNALLSEGWPRELARMVLPFSTYSKMFCTLNLGNLFRFLELRDDAHAQYEIQVYAKAMKELITPIVPHCIEAFDND